MVYDWKSHFPVSYWDFLSPHSQRVKSSSTCLAQIITFYCGFYRKHHTVARNLCNCVLPSLFRCFLWLWMPVSAEHQLFWKSGSLHGCDPKLSTWQLFPEQWLLKALHPCLQGSVHAGPSSDQQTLHKIAQNTDISLDKILLFFERECSDETADSALVVKTCSI